MTVFAAARECGESELCRVVFGPRTVPQMIIVLVARALSGVREWSLAYSDCNSRTRARNMRQRLSFSCTSVADSAIRSAALSNSSEAE